MEIERTVCSEHVEEQPSGSTGCKAWSRWAFPLILLVAVALRLPTFYGTLPDLYWHDELNFIEGALHVEAAGIRDASFGEYQHGTLTYFVLFAVFGVWFVAGYLTGIFPDVRAFALQYVTNPSEFVLLARMVMLAASVATVALTYVVGKRLFDAKAALFASFLMAASFQSIHMTYGKEDGLFTFLVLLAFLCAERALVRDDQLRWYALTGALLGAATAVKYFGFVGVALLALLVGLGSGFRSREGWQRFGVSLVGFVAVFLCCVPGIVLDPDRFVNSVWKLRGANAGIQMAAPSGGGEWYGYLWTTYVTADGVVLTALFYGGVALVIWERSRKGLLLLAYSVSLTLALTMVLLMGRGVEVPYYQLSTIPFLSLAAGQLLAWMAARPGPAKWSAWALLFVAVLGNVADTVRFQRLINTEDSRTVVRKWIEDHVPGDTSILVEGAIRTFVLEGPQLKENQAALERDHLANREEGGSGRMAETKLQALGTTDQPVRRYDLYKVSNISANHLRDITHEYVVVRSEEGKRVVESSGRSYQLVFSVLPDSPQLFRLSPLLSVADIHRLRRAPLFDGGVSPLMPGPAVWVFQAMDRDGEAMAEKG